MNRIRAALRRWRRRDAVETLGGRLAPGWYPDLGSDGERERWFDGERWTERRRPRR